MTEEESSSGRRNTPRHEDDDEMDTSNVLERNHEAHEAQLNVDD